jgi:hypothetical protein
VRLGLKPREPYGGAHVLAVVGGVNSGSGFLLFEHYLDWGPPSVQARSHLASLRKSAHTTTAAGTNAASRNCRPLQPLVMPPFHYSFRARPTFELVLDSL